MDSIRGFLREDGGVGIRNHLLIIASVSCAGDAAKKIAAQLPGSVSITHQHGCGHLLDEDIAQTRRTIVGNACNPNVGACLVVGLGCELLDSSDLAEEIADISKKRVEYIRIQDHHGSVQTVAEGAALAQSLQKRLSAESERVDLPISRLTVGLAGNAVKNSDENKFIGELSDRLLARGLTVIQGESSEFLFAERAALARCSGQEEREALTGVFGRVMRKIEVLNAPPPADIGREKLERMGKANFSQIVLYGRKPTRSGLIHMESPRFLTETISGMTAAGAQLIVAATPLGLVASPTAPTVDCRDLQKAGSTETDLDRLIDVINGRPTDSEIRGVNTFAITRIGPST